MNKFVKCNDGSYYLLNAHNSIYGTVLWTNSTSITKAKIGYQLFHYASPNYNDRYINGDPIIVTDEKEISDLIEKYPELFEFLL